MSVRQLRVHVKGHLHPHPSFLRPVLPPRPATKGGLQRDNTSTDSVHNAASARFLGPRFELFAVCSSLGHVGIWASHQLGGRAALDKPTDATQSNVPARPGPGSGSDVSGDDKDDNDADDAKAQEESRRPSPGPSLMHLTLLDRIIGVAQMDITK